jgi:hypothetical protein
MKDHVKTLERWIEEHPGQRTEVYRTVLEENKQLRKRADEANDAATQSHGACIEYRDRLLKENERLKVELAKHNRADNALDPNYEPRRRLR